MNDDNRMLVLHEVPAKEVLVYRSFRQTGAAARRLSPYDGGMDEPACPGCRELARRVAALEAKNAELTRKLEESLRAGKRQAAPRPR